MVETWLVGAILVLDLIAVIDQVISNGYQRRYWSERAGYYQRRAHLPPKTKATVAVVSTVAVDANASK